MKKLLTILVMMALLMVAGCSKTTLTGTAPEDTGKQAILLVSFGTSYEDTRALTIDALEDKYKEAYPDYEVLEAFTSQIIIDLLKERDHIEIYNVEEAFNYLKDNKFAHVVVQPTLIMNGAEYDEMLAVVEAEKENFVELKLGNPLLSQSEDYEAVVESLRVEIEPKMATENEAVVFMGHGTHHFANATYPALEYYFHDAGMKNVFIGTVEGYPTVDDVIERLNENGITKVTLYPFMLVAGDHATNDMSGDEEGSWKTMLKKEGFEVETVLRGLGEDAGVQALYLEHTEEAINAEMLEAE
ncbi:MAG: sirohydrochlorin cobaltochelatase [Clostridia bacterium]|nr:sirohydrochlorin cobaltochelatase [Clostridia bacterium]